MWWTPKLPNTKIFVDGCRVWREGLIYTVRNSIKYTIVMRGRGTLEEEEIADRV